MSSGYSKRSDVKARGQEADPRTSEEQAVSKAAARERREAYVAGTSWPRCAPRPG